MQVEGERHFLIGLKSATAVRRFTFTWSPQGPVIDYDGLNSFWIHKIGQMLQGFDMYLDEGSAQQVGAHASDHVAIVRVFSPWDIFRSEQKSISPQPSDTEVSERYWKLSGAEYQSCRFANRVTPMIV